ncbi:MAG: GTPase Era [Acidimicrobiales bacterium]
MTLYPGPDSGGEPELHSGFVALVGRPNVGKSTLLNLIIGTKVAITSPVPHTTRTRVRAVRDRPGSQLVFVDTPGIHRPRTALGERLNETAAASFEDVDVCVLMVEANSAIGRGDRFIAELLPPRSVVVLNKVDRATRTQVLEHLAAAQERLGLVAAEFFPVSARSGDGVDELVSYLVARMPPGPRYFPPGMVSDVPEAFFVAELVREQLIRFAEEELPHSIACRVTEWEWPRIRCEILVERDSQKGIVIGHGGAVLKAAGTAVRQQLAPGAYLELFVKVEKGWQRHRELIERLGY